MQMTRYRGLFIDVALLLVTFALVINTSHAALPMGTKQLTACYFEQMDGALFKAWIVNPHSDLPYLDADELKSLQKCKTSVPRSAKGSSLDFRIVLAPKNKSSRTIEVNTTPFRSTQGNTSISVDAFHVQNWYQALGGWRGIGRPGLMPDRSIYIPELLVHDDTLVTPLKASQRNALKLTDINGTRYTTPLESGEDTPRKNARATEMPLLDAVELQPLHQKDSNYRQMWFSIAIPVTTANGRYESNVTFTDTDAIRQTVTLRFDASPVVLKPTEKIYSLYYKGRLEHSLSDWVSSDMKGPSQLLAELRDMKRHGITNPVVYQPLDNIKLFERYLKTREDAGYANDTLYLIYLNTSQTTLASGTMSLRYALDKVSKATAPFNAENIFVYGEDEATAQQLLAQESAWKIANTQGYSIFAAGSAFPRVEHSPGLKLFNSARSPNPTQAKVLQRHGIKVLNYANPQGGAESPFVYRRNYGVLLWAADYDGAMIYAYQDSMGDGWNDFDHAYRDHNLTYPTAAGPIATIAWKGLSAGIDDMRYLETLETHALNTLRTKSNDPAALRAIEFLEELRSSILPYLEPDEPTRDFYLDHQQLREHIIDLLSANSIAPIPPVNLKIQ